jgi:hypothetical protein
VKFPSLEDLAKVIRDSGRLKRDKRIDPDTQVCRDLGISGNDGAKLLNAIEGHYQIGFKPELYDRIESARSIHGEDRDESPVIQSLFGGSFSEQPPFTVGQLYKVVLQELRALPDNSQVGSRAS